MHFTANVNMIFSKHIKIIFLFYCSGRLCQIPKISSLLLPSLRAKFFHNRKRRKNRLFILLFFVFDNLDMQFSQLLFGNRVRRLHQQILSLAI